MNEHNKRDGTNTEYNNGKGSGGSKLIKFINKNLLVIVCVPLIVSIHYTWMLIQRNPKLVPKQDYKELPVITVRKYQY